MNLHEALQFKVKNNRQIIREGYIVRLYIFPSDIEFKKFLENYLMGNFCKSRTETDNYNIGGIWGEGSCTKCCIIAKSNEIYHDITNSQYFQLAYVDRSVGCPSAVRFKVSVKTKYRQKKYP